nr:sialate O-acetylesterase [Pseudoxanthomonas dokdonensis]
MLALPVLAQSHQPDAGNRVLDALFQDHAVLQRDAPIPIWGRATPGDSVVIEFDGRRSRSRADASGHWQAELQAHRAGGPYQLSASTGSGQQQTVRDLLVGDVWLCSGQSNMELQVQRTLDSRSEIAGASDDGIRLLTVPQVGAASPQAGFGKAVAWQTLSPDSVRDFSAACYYFARELRKTVPVPMGLINAAWGGSRIQAWMSEAALRQSASYDRELDVLDTYARDPALAVRQWGTLWQDWWSQQSTTTPWAATGNGKWTAAPRQLTAWESWGVPALADFNGMLWYRTRVRLTAPQAAQPARLLLGNVDEVDQSWVNGQSVGSSYGADEPRSYALPAGLLQAGDNLIVVNALDTYRDGGMVGPAESRALLFADGSRVALDEAGWQYQIVPPAYGTPPRAPWQTAAGLSTLYNGMIAPLGRYGLRGMLWYQGESNTAEAQRYAQLLPLLRDDWRRQFGGERAWLIVQLANFGNVPTTPVESEWSQLREVQRQVANADPHSALAVAIDIGESSDIHPANKQELGRRLARAARHVAYDEALPASGPVPVSAQRQDDAVVVTFSDITGALVARGADQPIGFQLCGEAAGSCHYADARIDGRQVQLRASGSAQATPTRVRYCWGDSPVCTLYDGAPLPAGPFELPISH